MFLQFIKFCVVGGTGVVVDFGITFPVQRKTETEQIHRQLAGIHGRRLDQLPVEPLVDIPQP